VSDAQDVNSALAVVVPANAGQPYIGQGDPPVQLGGNEGGPARPDPINAPTGEPVPLMPNLAFDPTDGYSWPRRCWPAGPAQAIETAGGFVVAGGVLRTGRRALIRRRRPAQ